MSSAPQNPNFDRQSPETAQTPQARGRTKLLYLEDDAVDRRAFLRMVRQKSLPYDITSTETLAEARAQLAQTRFDIIVTDYHLPDGHSTELFDEVRDTPFVLLTGTLEENLALRTLERGADDYLPKTSDQRHLEALPFTIEKTLHRKYLASASDGSLKNSLRPRPISACRPLPWKPLPAPFP